MIAKIARLFESVRRWRWALWLGSAVAVMGSVLGWMGWGLGWYSNAKEAYGISTQVYENFDWIVGFGRSKYFPWVVSLLGLGIVGWAARCSLLNQQRRSEEILQHRREVTQQVLQLVSPGVLVERMAYVERAISSISELQNRIDNLAAELPKFQNQIEMYVDGKLNTPINDINEGLRGFYGIVSSMEREFREQKNEWAVMKSRLDALLN